MSVTSLRSQEYKIVLRKRSGLGLEEGEVLDWITGPCTKKNLDKGIVLGVSTRPSRLLPTILPFAQ